MHGCYECMYVCIYVPRVFTLMRVDVYLRIEYYSYNKFSINIFFLKNSTENMSRWSAEPVKAVFVDCNIFIANKAGYPVLPKNYQRVLNYFWKYPIQIIIKGNMYRL